MSINSNNNTNLFGASSIWGSQTPGPFIGNIQMPEPSNIWGSQTPGPFIGISNYNFPSYWNPWTTSRAHTEVENSLTDQYEISFNGDGNYDRGIDGVLVFDFNKNGKIDQSYGNWGEYLADGDNEVRRSGDIMRYLNGNNDGSLLSDEDRDFADSIDRNHDGSLDSAELKKAGAKVGIDSLTDKSVREAYESVAETGGSISGCPVPSYQTYEIDSLPTEDGKYRKAISSIDYTNNTTDIVTSGSKARSRMNQFQMSIMNMINSLFSRQMNWWSMM